jgi:16S rRNA (guanine(527)-N(7))-methyltransferase RsmG
MPTPREQFEAALWNNAPHFTTKLSADQVARLGQYYELLLKWNDRLHLVAPCSAEEFATRHVLESLLVLPHIGAGTQLIDVGSGAGLPALPCFVANARLHGTLIDSSRRKAVFLKEALHHLDLSRRVQVVADRFEKTVAASADVVTCRAIDRFTAVLPELIAWAPASSTLLFFGGEALFKEILRFLPAAEKQLIPFSERRFLIKAVRKTD